MKKLSLLVFACLSLAGIVSAQSTARDGLTPVMTAVRAQAPNAQLRVLAASGDTALANGGRASIWIYHWYNPTTQTWLSGMYMNGSPLVMPGSAQEAYFQDLSTTFVNSDVVMATAERNGGSNFRSTVTDLQVSLMGGTFPVSPWAPTGTPVWIASYSGTNNGVQNELVVVMNMTTGALIVATSAPEEIAAVMPERVSLAPNYPNPFNSSTTISYALPKSASVTLKVLDVTGREVASLFSGMQTPGNHVLSFRPEGGLPSGQYFLRLTTPTSVSTQPMLYLK